MSISSTANRYNVTLTNYARGLAQDLTSSIADFIAPEVVVPAATGQFKSFSDKNAFQKVDTSRAVGGSAKRLEFDATDPTFNCKPQALEIPIDDHERDESGDGDPLGIEKAKTMTLVQSAATSHESKVWSAMLAAKASDQNFDFTDTTEDPVAVLDKYIEQIAVRTGRMPNAIVLPIGIWALIRHNPEVIKRFPGAASIGVNRNQFSSLLLNPEIEMKIGMMGEDLNGWGLDADIETITTGDVFIFHRSASPTLYDPCFAKTFRTRRGGVDMVRTYREDSAYSDILSVAWSEDIQVVSSPSAARITNA